MSASLSLPASTSDTLHWKKPAFSTIGGEIKYKLLYLSVTLHCTVCTSLHCTALHCTALLRPRNLTACSVTAGPASPSPDFCLGPHSSGPDGCQLFIQGACSYQGQAVFQQKGIKDAKTCQDLLVLIGDSFSADTFHFDAGADNLCRLLASSSSSCSAVNGPRLPHLSSCNSDTQTSPVTSLTTALPITTTSTTTTIGTFTTTTTQRNPDQPTECPDGWLDATHHQLGCIKLVDSGNSDISWFEAQNICQDLMGFNVETLTFEQVMCIAATAL
jgi:hypothetical protein